MYGAGSSLYGGTITINARKVMSEAWLRIKLRSACSYGYRLEQNLDTSFATNLGDSGQAILSVCQFPT